MKILSSAKIRHKQRKTQKIAAAFNVFPVFGECDKDALSY